MLETVLKLVMTFENEDGGKVNLSIVDPRNNISEEEIRQVMELVVEKDIFEPNQLSLVKPLYAKIVNTETTEFDLV